ncbi:protein of unknown function [Moritella yayanosii]|uniref:Uncharacterized protein n=1 Tax=Moritella yayanosii TaxID=69539 RepID=A0A330LLQ8_9GAMM|nr:protein of unknown function [Moritella yayanosii]
MLMREPICRFYDRFMFHLWMDCGSDVGALFLFNVTNLKA